MGNASMTNHAVLTLRVLRAPTAFIWFLKIILQEKTAIDQEQILLQNKIAKARKSLGVRAKEPNPY